MSLSVISFDKTPRETIEVGTIMHHLIRGHQLFNDAYQLKIRKVRGLKNIAIYAREPGEEDRPREYRPVLTGRKAIRFATMLERESGWSLDDNPRTHEHFQYHGEYMPDYTDPSDPWEYGY